MKFNQHKKIVLASGSPRRKAYLERYSLQFDIIKAEINESALAGEIPLVFSQRMADEKADWVMKKCGSDCVVIAADTIVVYRGEILGKPSSKKDVFPMLSQLNGKSHEVITSYVVLEYQNSGKIQQSVRTEVEFNLIPDQLLQAYATSSEPLDKAGAYSIQGLGTFLVRSISGSYNNVVGLPIEVLLQDLVSLGVISMITV